jgi:Resolvase, N terminal domain
VATRDKLKALLDFVREGDAIVVTKPDRLERSTAELLATEADLSKRGIGLVPRVVHIAGYNLFSFTRASAAVKCQSALTWFLFRLSSQAATSSTRVSLLEIRRSRH